MSTTPAKKPTLLQSLRCSISHKPRVTLRIAGDFNNNTFKGLLCCERCGQRFIYSDEHEACLRYDDKPKFQTDILLIYTELTPADLWR